MRRNRPFLQGADKKYQKQGKTSRYFYGKFVTLALKA